MVFGVTSKNSSERVSEIVDQTKMLSERLRDAIIHLEDLTEDRFDTNATELSKTVENIRMSYMKLTAEHQAIKEEIKNGEEQLEETLKEYQQILDENVRLAEIESSFLNSQTLADEHKKVANDLRRTLKTLKLLTGVHFDFNEPSEILSGYIGISGDKPSNSTIIPFEINKNNNEIKVIWDKIDEACSDVCE